MGWSIWRRMILLLRTLLHANRFGIPTLLWLSLVSLCCPEYTLSVGRQPTVPFLSAFSNTILASWVVMTTPSLFPSRGRLRLFHGGIVELQAWPFSRYKLPSPWTMVFRGRGCFLAIDSSECPLPIEWVVLIPKEELLVLVLQLQWPLGRVTLLGVEPRCRVDLHVSFP